MNRNDYIWTPTLLDGNGNKFNADIHYDSSINASIKRTKCKPFPRSRIIIWFPVIMGMFSILSTIIRYPMQARCDFLL